MASGIYDCGSKYLDVTGDKARCVDESQCAGILANFAQLCLKEEDCQDRDGRYLYDDGTKKECTSAESCREKNGGYAYGDLHQCLSVTPDLENGNFTERYDGDYVYMCGYSSYTDKILRITYAARCVLKDKCLYGKIAGVADGDICRTREQWLAESPKNYIDNGLDAGTHEVDITPSVTADDLCDVQGSILVEGRICACPIEMYEEEVYDDS